MEKLIQTKYGMMEGIDCGDHYEYRGIPFAKPPLGELRWQKPEKCEPWEGIYKANNFKAKAIQPDNGNMELYGKEFYGVDGFTREASEDCLYLNIWCPKDAVHGQCPVAVWIHGGAFHHGYSSEVEFDGAEYCRRDIILVTVAYRLGVFGFLSVPELVEKEGHSGNYGLMDQIMALHWVRENIADFGGNPDNVTLFGQSAGAMSTLCLCNSKKSSGLFHRAIMQSGGGYRSPLNMMADGKCMHEIYEGLKKNLGISHFEQMKTIPAEQICDAYFKLDVIKQGQEFLKPCVDGYILEKTIDQSIQDGDMADLEYILGSTKDDLLCDRQKGSEPAGGLWDAAAGLACLCQEKNRKIPYLYYFAHDLPGDKAGAFHSSELWYMFGTWKRCWRPMGKEDEVLSERMLDSWCSFIKTGNPNCKNKDEEWKPYMGKQYKLFK